MLVTCQNEKFRQYDVQFFVTSYGDLWWFVVMKKKP